MTRGDDMESIWSNERPEIVQKSCEIPGTADVVIIGGGMAGLLCAYRLNEAGIRAIVLEADTVGSGQTKNTTAKITSQHGLIYDKLTRIFGEEMASQYGRASQKAIDEFERIIFEHDIVCDFVRATAYLYTKTVDGAGQLERERTAAKKAGIKASLTYETELPFSVKIALKYEEQAQFHPLKFLGGISKGLEIYEHTRVIQIKDHEVVTNRGSVVAKKIVMATHFPFVNFPGFYFARMHQERSYVLAARVCKENEGCWTPKGMYKGIDADGLSLRSARDVVLLGGKSHRTGVPQSVDPFDGLRKEANSMWDNWEEIGHWAAQDCMTLDSLPYIGMFSAEKPDWYVATGFEKWGMTNSMLAAMVICDAITGRTNSYAEIVAPQRKMTKASFGAMTQEMMFTAKNFLTLKGPRCPHLGCRLQWNPYEKTWDCPCHGSSFREDGTVIDNPAQKQIGEE